MEACYHWCALLWVCPALVVTAFTCSRLGETVKSAMAGLCRIARTEVSRLSGLPGCNDSISPYFPGGVTMQSQRACWSTEAQAVFVRFPHARRCCAAVAALSRDLLYVARGKVGSRGSDLI